MAQPYPRSNEGASKPSVDLTVFRDAVETAPEAVFWIDGDGRFVYVNERACASLGYSHVELSALHVWEIDPTLDRQGWAELWKQTAKGLPIATSHRRKDGTFVPVEV